MGKGGNIAIWVFSVVMLVAIGTSVFFAMRYFETKEEEKLSKENVNQLLEITPFATKAVTPTTFKAPIPTSSEEPGLVSSDYINTCNNDDVISVSFVVPLGFVLRSAETVATYHIFNQTLYSPEYRMSEDAPVLLFGVSITLDAQCTVYKDVSVSFSEDDLGQEIAENVEDVSVMGVPAIQYDYSYEGWNATVTRFIMDGVEYKIILRYANDSFRDQYWRIYQNFIDSFSVQ